MQVTSNTKRTIPQSAFQWAIYIWRQCPRRDCLEFVRAFIIAVTAIALMAIAPLFFARILDLVSTQTITDQALISMVAAFLVLRFLGLSFGRD